MGRCNNQQCTKYKSILSLIGVIQIQTGDTLQKYGNIIYLTIPKESQMEWIEKLNDGHGVKSKYNDLKDELLNNNFCNISLPQYDAIHIIALKTKSFAKWKIGSGTHRYVERYNIKENSPIKLNHIMADVIYSNYYEFSERYKNTFDINNRLEHTEFIYFIKHLTECVTVYDPLKDLNVSNIYIKPVSFTDSFEIILCHGITISSGLIKLCQLDNNGAFNMNCNRFSDFVFENQYIIGIYTYTPMRIDSILHIKTYCDYKEYIYAINDLEHLLWKLPAHNMNNMTKHALNKMGSYTFSKQKIKNNHKTKVPSYIGLLFDKKCNLLNDIDYRQIFEINTYNNDTNNYILKSLLITNEKGNDNYIIKIKQFQHIDYKQQTQMLLMLKI